MHCISVFVFSFASLGLSSACSSSYYYGYDSEKKPEAEEEEEGPVAVKPDGSKVTVDDVNLFFNGKYSSQFGNMTPGADLPKGWLNNLENWLTYHKFMQNLMNHPAYYENASFDNKGRGPNSNWPSAWEGFGDGHAAFPIGSGGGSFGVGGSFGGGGGASGGGAGNSGADGGESDVDDDQIFDDFANPGGIAAYCYDKTPGEFGDCNDTVVRWSYYPYRRKCMSFDYSGCGGNNNNFVSELVCEQTCIVPPPPKTCDMATNIYVEEYGIKENRRSKQRRCD